VPVTDRKIDGDNLLSNRWRKYREIEFVFASGGLSLSNVLLIGVFTFSALPPNPPIG
jgi:hypothetical protein